MTDEQEGFVLLFPENFPEWALTAEERRARLELVEDPEEEEEENEDS
jgi:hypothetical protein